MNAKPLSPPVLSSDIALLLTLPHQTTRSLLSSSSTPPSSNDFPTSKPHTALDFLTAYTPSTTDHEASQNLANAYISEMRGIILSMDLGEGEKLGRRIDEVRELGEGVSEALKEVKV
jgi:hypothetical protein